MNNKEPGMSLFVQTTARIAVGFMLVFGCYLFTHGHVSPGGGLAGGVILALSFVLLMLAYGKEVALTKLPRGAAAFIEKMGALLFLSIALLGYVSGYFFLNFIAKGEPFRLFSAGIIPLLNVAIAMKVATGIFAIFTTLVLLKHVSGNGHKK